LILNILMLSDLYSFILILLWGLWEGNQVKHYIL
jgi:hypothetical protein